MSGVALRLEGLHKEYRVSGSPVHAVAGIDLAVDAGSSVAIVGPSGCGKSTLLGLIGGLELPSQGRLWFGDIELSALAESKRAELRRTSIGFVFQSYDLLPFLTATENVEFQLALNENPGRWEPCPRADRSAGPRRALRKAARPALRRPAPAGRDRPRPRPPAGAHPGRRADRRARHRVLGGGRRPPPRGTERNRAPPWWWSPTTSRWRLAWSGL